MKVKSMLIILLLALSTILLIPQARAQAPTISVVITPSPPINPPAVFRVDVTITDASNVKAWEFYLRWNPNMVKFINISEGDFLSSAGSTEFLYYLSALGEYVQAYANILDEGVTASGDGILATMYFECFDTGDPFYFTLYNTKLWDVELNLIDHDTQNQMFFTTFPVVKFYYYTLNETGQSPTPENPEVGDTVVFNASESYAYTGRNIASYVWNFGDGNITTTTDPIVTHSYANYGTYAFNLTVIDDQGEAWYKTAKIAIIRDPMAFDVWPSIIDWAETPVKAGDWVWWGEPVYMWISTINAGTLYQNYTINFYLVGPTGDILVDTREVTNLGPYPSDFDWWFTLVFMEYPGHKNYTFKIEVIADIDNNPDNNIMETTAPLYVRILGDVDDSGKVDVADLSLLGAAWFTTPGDPDWNEYCDFNRDQKVDVGDLSLLGAHWFETDP